jgi:glutaredoxin-like protein
MSLFNQETKDQLKQIFAGLKNPVTIALFTEDDCASCPDTVNFMTEVKDLSEHLNLENYSLDSHEAKTMQVDKAPAIVLLDSNKKNHHVKFYGIPAGHEINSFISGLMEVSGAGESLPEPMRDKLDGLDKKVNIKVFVTLSCPHCSGAVSKAHKLAFENENIQAEMIECATFPELANQYNVSGVPKIVFNDGEELIGNQPFEQFLEAVLKA